MAWAANMDCIHCCLDSEVVAFSRHLTNDAVSRGILCQASSMP
jgi:hypothetical protein